MRLAKALAILFASLLPAASARAVRADEARLTKFSSRRGSSSVVEPGAERRAFRRSLDRSQLHV